MSQRLYSIDDVVRDNPILSRSRVEKAIKAGQLRAKRLGRNYTITAEALDEFIENLPDVI